MVTTSRPLPGRSYPPGIAVGVGRHPGSTSSRPVPGRSPGPLGCPSCQLHVVNVANGTSVTTAVPGGHASELNGTITDDGAWLAVQLRGGSLAVVRTSAGTHHPAGGTLAVVWVMELRLGGRQSPAHHHNRRRECG
jgi:hypothetical protein